MFSQELSEELYVRAPATIMWQKLIASKHSYHQHNTLAYLILDGAEKKLPRKIKFFSMENFSVAFELILNFYH